MSPGYWKVRMWRLPRGKILAACCAGQHHRRVARRTSLRHDILTPGNLGRRLQSVYCRRLLFVGNIVQAGKLPKKDMHVYASPTVSAPTLSTDRQSGIRTQPCPSMARRLSPVPRDEGPWG